MKVLLHVHAMCIGGAERQLVYLANELVGMGVEVHIVTLYGNGTFERSLDLPGGCVLHSLNRRSKLDFSVVGKLARYIRDNGGFDVIQGWMPPCNSFAAMAGLLVGRKVFMGIRSSNMKNPFGAAVYELLDRVFARLNVHAVIYNSYAGCEHYERNMYPKRKRVVIHNGIRFPDSEEFPVPLDASPCRIGMIARLDPMKDHLTMFGALAILRSRGASVELHLFGEGREAWREHLRERAVGMGIGEQVVWRGWAGNVWDAMRDIDVLVSSSSYGEGLSNTLLEALVAGRVVVATDVGDARRVLHRDGENYGWVVHAGDPEELAATLESVLADPQAARDTACKGPGMVRRCFDIPSMAQAYMSLYRDALPIGTGG